MKTLMRSVSPIAIAIGLAIGAGSALAQQPGADDSRSGQSVVQPRPGETPQPGRAQPGQSQVQPGQAQPGSQARPANQPQPGSQSPAADQAPESGAASDLDQLAAQNAELSQFVDAVKAAGLADALTGGTEYTVFAPTNSALENADIDSLMKPENRADLVSLLRAHIVADDIDAQLASEIDQAQTIDGGFLDISAEAGRIMVGGNEATAADGIDLGNLRVYAVDEVLGEGRPPQDSQASLRRSGNERSEAAERADSGSNDNAAQ
jgi:uncharacterized surface protein with fasciclin (FAS1) repeats